MRIITQFVKIQVLRHSFVSSNPTIIILLWQNCLSISGRSPSFSCVCFYAASFPCLKLVPHFADLFWTPNKYGLQTFLCSLCFHICNLFWGCPSLQVRHWAGAAGRTREGRLWVLAGLSSTVCLCTTLPLPAGLSYFIFSNASGLWQGSKESWTKKRFVNCDVL